MSRREFSPDLRICMIARGRRTPRLAKNRSSIIGHYIEDSVTHPTMAIAIAFFGRAPMWLPAFLLSCGRNPDVQWFLYTDFEAPAPFPPNVTLRRMPLSEFSQRASNALGTRIEIQANFTKKIIDSEAGVRADLRRRPAGLRLLGPFGSRYRLG